ncbi:DUF2802 domain-containing protein [Pseudoalteromonas tunicata]|jgi:hypothetical protein|uniref:DUF2802 domain-containing protein n=1 Tax=Pseudoalteromonas tunicata D2 TaxID=87626 RepID=A4C6A7_9GAMM|nr:hypothetical protein PTUN_a3100 [Pseudoalteromonas tunicata]AXT31060.1 DUF2802 domain-containing protein [Pseudoalteromonas tunicata]EAR29511.1 hypothetical protein PTD2_11864 [Pseudoalteromonas tunicata D2]
MIFEVLVLLNLAISFFAFYMIFKGKKNYQLLIEKKDQELTALTQQMTILRSEIEEVRGGLLSIGKRILKLEHTTKELIENQQELKFVDPDSKMYSRAVKMVELGADLDEIIKECELPRAEAELLISLHQQKN